LTLNQIADLLQRDKSVISKHIKNIFDTGELDPARTVAKFATVQTEWVTCGFAMDDERLKHAGGVYFDELLACIRDIRSSERLFWRKVLDIYARSEDYDPSAEASQKFFAVVQN